MRYKITLSYDGTPFSGWQIQPNAPSIQESLQRVLGILLKEEIAVTGAGRTDAGVHAVGYVAHFDGPEGLDTAALGYKLTSTPVSTRPSAATNISSTGCTILSWTATPGAALINWISTP